MHKIGTKAGLCLEIIIVNLGWGAYPETLRIS